jgi:hypothetical protein
MRKKKREEKFSTKERDSFHLYSELLSTALHLADFVDGCNRPAASYLTQGPSQGWKRKKRDQVIASIPGAVDGAGVTI